MRKALAAIVAVGVGAGTTAGMIVARSRRRRVESGARVLAGVERARADNRRAWAEVRRLESALDRTRVRLGDLEHEVTRVRQRDSVSALITDHTDSDTTILLVGAGVGNPFETGSRPLSWLAAPGSAEPPVELLNRIRAARTDGTDHLLVPATSLRWLRQHDEVETLLADEAVIIAADELGSALYRLVPGA